ncbi:MAG: hypothetical protein K6D61_02655 [Prevotella sp.]|nr:hypothetical protein [Prevotella sp.]
MNGMFGGNRLRTYMLTPPVSVQAGENLVFSARKPQSEGFSFDLKAIMGMTDTIFVVERTVYGKNRRHEHVLSAGGRHMGTFHLR